MGNWLELRNSMARTPLEPLKVVRARGMDGWMTCDFTSFTTVFQSYQDDERLIMKGCVQWSYLYG